VDSCLSSAISRRPNTWIAIDQATRTGGEASAGRFEDLIDRINRPGSRVTFGFAYLSLSSFQEDARSGLIPSQVKFVVYDLEPHSATPMEVNDPLNSVLKFASLARRKKLTMVAAPSCRLAGPPIQSRDGASSCFPLLLAIAKKVDVIDLQYQRAVGVRPNDNGPGGFYADLVHRTVGMLRQGGSQSKILAEWSTNPRLLNATRGRISEAVENVSPAVDGFWINVGEGEEGGLGAAGVIRKALH
jgi:hypothetical protein